MAVGDIERLLTVRSLGGTDFAAAASGTGERRTYGGLLAAQALAAAAATAGDRACHSLHLLFVAAGDAGCETTLHVERLRDGASFSQRRVRAHQDGRELVAALASFHAGDEGPEHGITMPDAPAPDTLEDQRERRRRNAVARGETHRRLVAEELLDARPVALPGDRTRGFESRRLLWFRARERLPDTPALHQAAIAFASDMGLVHVGLEAHHEIGEGGALDAASLDHAIWFHRLARADEWLLHVQRSPVAQGGRGLAQGEVFDASGRLIASVAQEILVRRKRG